MQLHARMFARVTAVFGERDKAKVVPERPSFPQNSAAVCRSRSLKALRKTAKFRSVWKSKGHPASRTGRSHRDEAAKGTWWWLPATNGFKRMAHRSACRPCPTGWRRLTTRRTRCPGAPAVAASSPAGGASAAAGAPVARKAAPPARSVDGPSPCHRRAGPTVQLSGRGPSGTSPAGFQADPRTSANPARVRSQPPDGPVQTQGTDRYGLAGSFHPRAPSGLRPGALTTESCVISSSRAGWVGNKLSSRVDAKDQANRW